MVILLKKNEQHEVALREFKEKYGKDVSALKNETKRFKDLDQLKKATTGCDQVEDEEVTFKQIITQLKAGNALEDKNLDDAIGEAEKARINEHKSKLGERLASAWSRKQKAQIRFNQRAR
nr:unnamed protein product [Callosobruchus chinensis]